MDLTTAARVKALISSTGTAPTGAGTEIDALIDTVSAAAEAYMDRQALAASTTEYFDVVPGSNGFRLKAFPVTLMTSVNYDPEQTWAAATALDSTQYLSPVYEPRGWLKLRFGLWPTTAQPKALKVVYTGGMAADVTAFIAAFPDIAGAIDLQVSHLWHRRNQLGVQSISGDAGSITFTDAPWLPQVKAILDRHRRISFGGP